MPTATNNTDLWTPTLGDVAILLRLRHVSRGAQQTTFDATTDPTATEVTALIQNALDLVAGRVGQLLPEAVWGMAKRVVALRTALSIEPGSRDFNEARLRELRAQYEEELPALIDAAQDAEDGGDPGEVDDPTLADPIGHFPPGPCDTGRVPGTEVTYPYSACYEW